MATSVCEFRVDGGRCRFPWEMLRGRVGPYSVAEDRFGSAVSRLPSPSRGLRTPRPPRLRSLNHIMVVLTLACQGDSWTVFRRAGIVAFLQQV